MTPRIGPDLAENVQLSYAQFCLQKTVISHRSRHTVTFIIGLTRLLLRTEGWESSTAHSSTAQKGARTTTLRYPTLPQADSIYFDLTSGWCCCFPTLFDLAMFFTHPFWAWCFLLLLFFGCCLLLHMLSVLRSSLPPPPPPVGVTVCVKPPLCRRSSQCDRSSGPKCSSCSKKCCGGVCEVNGKMGEEANKGR